MKRAQPLNINLHYYYNIAVFWCMILNIEHYVPKEFIA